MRGVFAALLMLVGACAPTSRAEESVSYRDADLVFSKLVKVELQYSQCDAQFFKSESGPDGRAREGYLGDRYPRCVAEVAKEAGCVAPREILINAALFYSKYYAGNDHAEVDRVAQRWMKRCGLTATSIRRDLTSRDVVSRCKKTRSFLLMPLGLSELAGPNGPTRYQSLPPPGYSAFHCGYGLNNLQHRSLVCERARRYRINGEPSPTIDKVDADLCAIFLTGPAPGVEK